MKTIKNLNLKPWQRKALVLIAALAGGWGMHAALTWLQKRNDEARVEASTEKTL